MGVSLSASNTVFLVPQQHHRDISSRFGHWTRKVCGTLKNARFQGYLKLQFQKSLKVETTDLYYLRCFSLKNWRCSVRKGNPYSISVTSIQSSYVPFRRDIRFRPSLPHGYRIARPALFLTGLEPVWYIVLNGFFVWKWNFFSVSVPDVGC